MSKVIFIAAFFVLVAGPERVESQVEKTPKSETKGTFVTTVGTHTLYGGRLTLKIEEKDGKLDSYVKRNRIGDEPGQPGEVGPLNPRIEKGADWFIYAASADEVWWFDGKKNAYWIPYNNKMDTLDDGRVYQLRLYMLLRLAPPEVLARLPQVFKEGGGAEKIEGTNVDNITANDLAHALGVRWWSYELRFGEPVDAISFRPCELRRRPDGTWHRRYLAEGRGQRFGAKDRHQVAFFIAEGANGRRYNLKIDGTWHEMVFTKHPNFENTSPPNPTMIVDGCLVLAVEEKRPAPGKPRTIIGDELCMIRLIGLQISTDKLMFPDEDPESTRP